MGGRQQRRRRVSELLEMVGIPALAAQRYPHEFSGGQRQRIGIARALSVEPDLIICDEPVSALDVSIQAQILNLLNDLQEEHNITYLFVTHNIHLIRYMTHNVAIMYLGQIVEYGDAEPLFLKPLHPYTRALISASILTLPEDEEKGVQQIILRGEMPSPLNPPSGCRFHTRCPEAMDICSKEEPTVYDIGAQQVKCHLYSDPNVREAASK